MDLIFLNISIFSFSIFFKINLRAMFIWTYAELKYRKLKLLQKFLNKLVQII